MNSKIFRRGSADTIIIDTGNPMALRFDAFTDDDLATPDFSKISIDVQLEQWGKKTTVFSGSLLPYLIAQKPHFANYAFCKQAIMSNGKAIFPAKLSFGQVINLDQKNQEEGKMTVKITIDNSALPGQNDYIQFSTVQGIGVQTYVPKFEQVLLPSDTSNYTKTLGHNVIGIDYVSTDENVALSSFNDVHPVEAVKLASDKYSINDTLEVLKFKNLERCQSVGSFSSYLGGCFPIYSAESAELDDVSIEMSLDPTNLNQSTSYLIVSRFEIDKKVLSKGVEMKRKHAKADSAKL